MPESYIFLPLANSARSYKTAVQVFLSGVSVTSVRPSHSCVTTPAPFETIFRGKQFHEISAVIAQAPYIAEGSLKVLYVG